ncbi:MAG: EAL domain-containing protein, partial [Gammaproteobacteria bacterium]
LYTLGSPGISLERLAELVQLQPRQVPIIALDGAGSADTAECMQQGATDCVAKDNEPHLQLVLQRTARCQADHERMRELEQALQEADRRCETLLNSSKDAIAYIADGMHVYANESYLELFGYERWDDFEGMPILDLVAPSDQEQFKTFLREYAKGKEPTQTLDLTLQPEEGEPFQAQLEFSPASIEGEPCTQVVIRSSANDKELQQKIQELEQRDMLTGLYNRPYFMERLRATIAGAADPEQRYSLLHLEIDGFDKIRKELGITAGDALLIEMGRVLMDFGGDGALIARFEGDAFTCLVPSWKEEDLKAYMQRLLEAVNNHIFEIEGKSLTLTASLGAAIIDDSELDANEVLSRAGRAYAEAAEQGGNQAVIYKPREGEMTQRQLDEAWSQRIKDALAHNRLKLLFQPIVSLHGDPGERYEVLMRMLDENGEAISPADFLESAERSGIAMALDRWVILNSIRRLAELRKQGRQLIFFVKLTAGSLLDSKITGWIREQIEANGVPPECFVFEIKEKTAVSHLKQCKAFIKAVHEMESEFTLDDFGTGSNPFQVLAHLPADYLKIHPQFMDNLPGSPENQETIKELTDQAHAQNKLVIAQHVDDAQILSILWGIGVNYIEGNFLSPPSEELNYDFSAMAG